MLRERAAGKAYSAYGFELGFLTDQKCHWPTQALYLFASHVTDGLQLKWGDRFAFGFTKNLTGNIEPFTGIPTSLGITPEGSIRAVLFWPYLRKDSSFVTSTGKVMVYIATGITEDEWELAKATTTAHVLLLLCCAGVGQRTPFERNSVLDNARWLEEWKRIESLDGEQAHQEIESVFGTE